MVAFELSPVSPLHHRAFHRPGKKAFAWIRNAYCPKLIDDDPVCCLIPAVGVAVQQTIAIFHLAVPEVVTMHDGQPVKHVLILVRTNAENPRAVP